MKIETHVHTRFSHDSILPLFAIRIMCKLKRIDCIAITDHNNIKGAKKFFEKYSNENFTVIIGEEIMTKEGEVIGLFLNKEIPAGLSFKKTIDEIKRQGGCVYIPHPYDLKRKKTVVAEEVLTKYKENIDCIESYNGRNVSSEYDIKQDEIATNLQKIKVVGSDAHTLIELGRTFMEYDGEIKISKMEDFIYVIKNVTLKKRKCIMFAHELTKMDKIIKILLRGEFFEVYRIINKRYKKRK